MSLAITRRRLSASLVAAAALLGIRASAQNNVEHPFQSKSGVDLDVPYVPTPPQVVDRMLSIANAGPNDIHYDLGCGDGRIVIAAAKKFKVKKAVGVDLDPERIAEANANAVAEKVTDRVTFIKNDLFKVNFTEANVLTLYLLPEINVRLRPIILDEMKPGTRVVSHAFLMGDWEPDQMESIETRNIFYWIVPAKVQGTWQWQVGNDTYRADLAQTYQKVAGTVSAGGPKATIAQPKLSGESLKFEATLAGGRTMKFDGKVTGATIAATVDIGGKATQVTAQKVN
jgi:hypothetical protein